MIGNKNKLTLEESRWEHYQIIIKKGVYSLMHQLLQQNLVSELIYKVLLLVEFLQIIYYSILPEYTFLWNKSLTQVLQEGVKYFQINGLINDSDSSFALIILYFVFTIQVIMIIIFSISLFHYLTQTQKPSTLIIYCTKLLSLYGILLNTVGLIPYINIYSHFIYCRNFNCYEGIYFLHFGISILGITTLFFFIFLFLFFYIDINPGSHLPFAASQSRIPLLKLGFKMALPIYTVVTNPNSEYSLFFLSFLLGYQLLIITQRYFSPKVFNKSVENLHLILEPAAFWITLCSFFCKVLTNQFSGLIYLIIGIPFVSSVNIMFLKLRNLAYLSQNVKLFKKESDVEMYIFILIHLIENKENAEERIYLEGVLKFHIKDCFKSQEQCNCRLLARKNEDNYEEKNENRKWFFLLQYILLDSFEKFQKSSKLHLLYAHILQGKLQNKYKALFELMITEEQKPNLQEEFAVFRYKQLIEDELIENDNRGTSSDVNSLIVFQNKFVHFLQSVHIAVNFHLEFWNKLLEESPDVQKLLVLGSKITNTVENVSEQFTKLEEMNPNHIKCLQCYGFFLKNIVNNDTEGNRIIEKSEYVQKSNQINKQFSEKITKYGENSNTSIIQISGNINSLGQITNTNNEISKLLHFSKNELLEQNISRIMPKVYADFHDQFILRYLNTSIPKVISKERILMCLNKKGYIVPCSVMIKVLPDLKDGIQIVGFIKDVNLHENNIINEENVTHYIIYRYDNLQIQGVSQSCHQQFGIPAHLMYGNAQSVPEFTIDSIIPSILNENTWEELKTSQQGINLQINTKFIQQNFLLEDEEEEEDQENENNDEGNQEKKNKFRVADIKVFLHDYSEFPEGAKVCVLKFQEIFQQLQLTEEEQPPNSKKSQLDIDKKEDQEQEQEEEEEEHNQQENQDIEQEEENENDQNNQEESNPSVQSQNNEDMRYLKDFKAQMSEKTIPKSIKILQKTVFFLLLIISSLAATSLIFKIKENQEINDGFQALNYLFQRPNLIQEINYNSRIIWMISNELIPSTLQNKQQKIDLSSQQKKNLEDVCVKLQEIQFNIIRSEIKAKQIEQKINFEQTYKVAYKLQNNSTAYDEKIFTDLVFQFITNASQLKNADIDQFKQSKDSYIQSTFKNFFFVRENGINIFREISLQLAKQFCEIYQDLTGKYATIFRIIMIVGILFIILSQFVLIPIVFQVIKSNNRVLSLFSFIPRKEIKILVEKCKQFIEEYLNLEDQQEDSKQEIEENEQKQEQKKEDDYEDNIIDQNKQQKLLNQKDSNKHIVIIQFSFISLIFILYFAFHFTYENTFLNHIQDLYNRYQILSLRSSYMKYDLLFSLEEIVTNEPIKDSTNKYMSQVYNDLIYDNEKKVYSQSKNSFPSIFDSYFRKFNNVDQSNICSSDLSSNYNSQLCEQIFEGILKKGVRTSIVSFTEGLRDILTNYRKNSKLQQAILNSDYFKDIQAAIGYLVPVMEELNNLLLQSSFDFLDERQKYETVFFSVYITFLFFVFFFIWVPYLKALNMKIWRTKGMLNMVPMEIITKNQELKSAFISGDILQAVK